MCWFKLLESDGWSCLERTASYYFGTKSGTRGGERSSCRRRGDQGKSQRPLLRSFRPW